MSILERHLGRVILHYTALSMIALVGLFLFVHLLDQLGDLGKGDYGLVEMARYLALTIPRNIYELFPMAALLGAILGLSFLANDSELIVMRASGVSVWQITLAAVKVGALLAIVAMLIGELVAPRSEAQAQRGRAEALHQRIAQQTDSGLWMRDGDTYFNAADVLPDLTPRNISLFEFNAAPKSASLRALTSAVRGEFVNGEWLLYDVKRSVFDAHGNATAKRHAVLPWASGITPQILAVFLLQPEQLSLSQLRHYIRHLRANRQHAATYQLAFWNRVVLPLSAAVMVVLAIPFVFVNLRAGNLGRSLFIGIMLGLGFYAASKGFGYFALAYGLTPLLGAVAPPLLFLLGALGMLRRVA